MPTTAWVQDKIDDVEAAVSGGMFPTIQRANGSGRGNRYAPSGGTWYCYGVDTEAPSNYDGYVNQVVAGGAEIPGGVLPLYTLCIKIA